MNVLKFAAASVLALSVAGCGSAARTSAAATGRLDCPDRQGELRRVSAAADGKTCVYSVGDRAEVTLQLIPVSGGGPEATLAQIENQLKAEAAPAAGSAAAAVGESADAASKAAAKAGDSARAAADAAAKAAAEAQADAAKAQARAGDGERDTWDDKAIEDRVNAKLREKGIDVDDSGDHGRHDDERANVDLPGLHIRAEGDKADVHVGPIHINANGETATVRSMDDVRLRGEGLSRVKRGIRAMFVYAGDELGGGYKYVGYEAAGPRTGPLAVAVVKSKSEGGFHGDVYGDVKTLVRRNGGT